jgi:PhzF family phenazine biosynthesis protein
LATLNVFQVDAFTDRPFAGNPAGVVLGADGLTDRQMQAIARELNNSETAFLMEADADDHDVRIRFFTPTVEVPSCGHATIAAHYVRARRLCLPRCRIWQKIKAGRLPVDVDLRNGDYFIVMTQATPQVSDPYRGELRGAVAEALGLGRDQIVPDLPIQRIDTGNSKVLIPVCSRSVLDKMTPNLSALVDIHRRVPNGGYFVFTLSNPDSGILAHSRMFAPNIGIAEDPVTGNGHGPLGVYLVNNGLVGSTSGDFYFKGRQGEAMGRAGTVEVWVEIHNGMPHVTRIGGRAVVVFETQMRVPNGF